MRTRNVTKYSLKKDLPDFRDVAYKTPWYAIFTLPQSVNLKSKFPPVYDQGELGSCTANAIAGMDQYLRMLEQLPNADTFVPSRLFIYYNERSIEGTVGQDSGASLRDGIKTIATLGVCPESMWTYNVAKFKEKPADACYTEALNHEAISYQRMPQNVTAMRKCLADGYSFVCGISVYDSFESDAVANGAPVPMPKPTENLLGGHAICIVGYDKKDNTFIFRNSWGVSWGLKGYNKIPTAYLTNPNLASDFWTLRLSK